MVHYIALELPGLRLPDETAKLESAIKSMGDAYQFQKHAWIVEAELIHGSHGITATDDRKSALAALNAVLGGGMSSRLFQEVREKRGLAYSVYSFAPSYADAGLFGLYAGCSPAKAGDVTELMLAEFHLLDTFFAHGSANRHAAA